jgi:hypothetical protein
VVDENREAGAPSDDDAAPISAAESLRMIQAQQAATRRSLEPDPRLIYWPWGFAWLIGFGLLFLRHGPQEQVRWNMPAWLPLATLFALMIFAYVLSAIAGARAGRQTRGESSTKGLMYGLTWFAAFGSNGVIASHFANLLPDPEKGLLWASVSVGTVAVLYMAGAAIWKAPDLFMLGCWLTLSNVGGVIAGPGWHSLVISLAGGGGLIVAGTAEWLRRRG